MFLALLAILFLGASCGPRTVNVSKALTIQETDKNQVGSSWDKHFYSEALKANSLSNSVLNKFKGIGKVTNVAGYGTGFYLGKIKGKHIVATNNHVLANNIVFNKRMSYCFDDLELIKKKIKVPRLDAIRFPHIKYTHESSKIELTGKGFRCKSFIGTWEEIDLALFEIDVSPKLEKSLAPYALSFDFSEDLPKGEPLMTAGFGKYRNKSASVLKYEIGGNCKTYADNNRLLNYNLKSKNEKRVTWTMLIGCDASSGDSGSPIFSKDSEKIVGVLWGGTDQLLNDDSLLNDFFKNDDERLWEIVNFAVPASEIKKFLIEKLAKDEIPKESIEVIKGLVL